ncbi:geraniol 8-hydroxylase-like [Pyrus x bretschneideri]|uniref:geraniol 8-hydroxylase-like n=1 Tax=Pyrus x bretschneideri TaxID=225117 RepID=UPI00202FE005|nr:geraniol 8-hydroxylase-like [Pyrus x bretschneideri]
MDWLSFSLYLILTWALLEALLYSLGRGKKSSRSKQLPPGPKPFPVIGNLHQLGDKPHKSLAKLAQKHGPLMSLKLGQVTSIVISSAAMAKEVLQTHDHFFCNRTIPDSLRAHDHHTIGLPWLPVSTMWRNLRKICNTQLFANKMLDSNENLRRRKLQELLEEVRQSSVSGQALDIGKAAFTTVLNLLSNTIFSIDLADPNSEMARNFKEMVCNIMMEAGKPNLGDCFPVLRKFDPNGRRRRMTKYFSKILDLNDRLINQRMELRKLPGSAVKNDVLETLLNIAEESSEVINKNDINHLLLVLFVAGSDTTSSTFQWAMAELLHNPEVLSKAQLELEQVIGKGNPIEESDIARLPYLQSIVKETFRLHPAVPLLLPRKAGADVEIEGYTVTKGAQVLVNTWAIGRDTNLWDEPNSFKPERFWGSEVDVRGRNFELIPFGGGRRICPGLPLAMRMLHLMLGSLIHLFDWKLPDGVTPKNMNMDDKVGLTLEMSQPLRAIPIPL